MWERLNTVKSNEDDGCQVFPTTMQCIEDTAVWWVIDWYVTLNNLNQSRKQLLKNNTIKITQEKNGKLITKSKNLISPK